MIRLNNVKIDIDDNNIKKAASRSLRIDQDKILGIDIIRRSIDARYGAVKYVYSLNVRTNTDEDVIIKKIKNASQAPEKKKWLLQKGSIELNNRPVIIGAGPAGLFAALLLSEYGYRPLVVERGKKVADRTHDVDQFFNNGKLNVESNISYGEGGAGTFSDGKLKTRISDPRCYYVIQKMVEAGAPEDILFDANPHVGTDILKDIIEKLRKTVIKNGGEFLFNHAIDDIIIKNGNVQAIVHQGNRIDAEAVILATGHSAKDTYQMLFDKGVKMEQKPFAMGVRIEHPREMIDKALYHGYADKLGAASYSLHASVGDMKAYTFCMCPGGVVVNSANEEGALCVNGMSEHDRSARNSNSAIVVGVTPKMTKGDNALSGIYYQKKYEKLAFELGGGDYNVPAMRVADFLNDDKPSGFEVMPTVMPKAVVRDIKEALPREAAETIKQAIPMMGKKIAGFDMGGAVLSAIESRTSSPVRIIRGDKLMSVNVDGLYPTGEGAGYAGGIVSSAVDGLRVASVIIEKYRS